MITSYTNINFSIKPQLLLYGYMNFVYLTWVMWLLLFGRIISFFFKATSFIFAELDKEYEGSMAPF